MTKHFLLISPDFIGDKMAGPGIRYWNFALELSQQLKVTLLTPNLCDKTTKESVKFSIKHLNVKTLEEELKKVDAVMLQGVTLFNYPLLKKTNVPLIIDIYDPFILENLELRKALSLSERINYHTNDLRILLEQLSYGDFFVCASEKQKDYWLGMLSALNRVNPITYDEDSSLKAFIDIVPFGLPLEEPVKTKKVLKGIYDGIGEDDKIILWGGGIWNWFDPLTLINAIYEISKERNDVKLFFLGIKHPNPDLEVMDMTRRSIELAHKLGINNKYVFFNYDWVPYNERQNYFMEADLGVSTHFLHLETRFSFRTRILDYIWCELPMIVTEGDSMAELVEEEKIGVVVKEKDVSNLKNSILEILNDNHKHGTFKANIKAIKHQFTWKNAIQPILNFSRQPDKKKDKEKVEIFYKEITDIDKLKYYLIRSKKLFSKDGVKKIYKKLMK